MKKLLALLLSLCLLFLMGGCGKEDIKEEKSMPTALVAYAAYRYDEGYQSAEGWMYDMTISSDQLQELTELTAGLKLTARDAMFEHGRGYFLVFRDEAGNITEQLLVLEDGSISKNGLMYEADGTEILLDWLDKLQIEEQHVVV